MSGAPHSSGADATTAKKPTQPLLALPSRQPIPFQSEDEENDDDEIQNSPSKAIIMRASQVNLFD